MFTRVAREVRSAYDLPSRAGRGSADADTELVWGLHANILYIGIRKWVYGLPVPRDIDRIVAKKVRGFLEGFPRTVGAARGRARWSPRRLDGPH